MLNLVRILSVFVLSITLAVPAMAQARDKVSLMLNWYVYGEHAPYFLGKERGYFQQEGIDLEIQEGRGSASTIQAVGAGSVDLGYADVGVMMKAVARGAPVKTIGVLVQSTPAAVISPADRNIKTAKDLIGKTIAITPGDAVTPIWPLYLSKVGIDEKQIKTVSGDAQVKMNSVTNRQADGLLGFATDQGARMPGIVNQPVNMLRFADAGLELVSLGVIAQNNAMRTRADVYKRFMKAATRSVEESSKDPAAAIAAMLKAYPAAGQPDAQLDSLKLSQTLYFTADTRGNKPFRLGNKTIDASLDTLVKYGGLEPRGKAEDYYTMEFLP
ncbi:MAG: ABC transporter substrate-binding protein [Variovorax sp.]